MTASKCLLFMLICLSWSTGSLAQHDISGIWRHADKAATIEFDLEKGEANIASHSNNPDAIGLNIIKQVTRRAGEKRLWEGKMYDGYKGRYVSVVIELTKSSTLQVKDSQGKLVLTLLR